MTRFLTLVLAAALGLLAAAAAHAQSTYVADSSAAAAAAHPWIDLAGLGEERNLDDEAVSGSIDIGFPFVFGSMAYDKVKIASNGMLQFDRTSGAGANSALPLTGAGGEPAIDAVMAPLWDDLHPGNDERHLRYATIGTAPNRVFVVSWLQVPYWCRGDTPSTCNPAKLQTKDATATFQVQLHEAGHFVYRYESVHGAGGPHAGASFRNPAGASIGYELGNADYVQFAYRSAAVAPGTAILWTRRLNVPGRFNAFETSTPAGAIAGVIRTKVAGAPFTLSLVALDATRTAVMTGFTGTVKVELLDARDSSGALDAASACRSTWVPLAGSAPQTLAFTAADLGRRAMTFGGDANAWRDVRVRVTFPDAGTPTAIGCSSDNFALRPDRFADLAATDGDAATPGTARPLASTAASGGVVHRAGRPFTVRTRAVNAAGAVTTNYADTPVATVAPCTGAACPATPGTLLLATAAAAGVIADHAATYSEAGAFDLRLEDTRFASVDAGDGSTAAEMTIASLTASVGRFVPDRFVLAPLVTPVLRTFDTAACATRSFTYVGQPFRYASAPQATVAAVAADGSVTRHYAGALWKLAGASVEQAYTPLAPASPGLDTGGIVEPDVASHGDGTGTIGGAAADRLRFVRPTGAPLAPFDADIALAWRVIDRSEEGEPGNGTIDTPAPLVFASIAFDAGNAFRHGVLRLASAYGSELNPLPVGVEALAWNGQSFVVHAADHCTTLPTASVSFAQWQRQLAPCETGLAPGAVRLAAGRAFFALRRPGSGNAGSADLRLHLGASVAAGVQTCAAPGPPVAALAADRPWLQGNWNGTTGFAADPTARASFGQYRSPLVYLREVH